MPTAICGVLRKEWNAECGKHLGNQVLPDGPRIAAVAEPQVNGFPVRLALALPVGLYADALVHTRL